MATSPQWGSSWKVYILPYIEQANIYRQWTFNSHSGYNNNTNGALVNNITIPPLRCPSSVVPDFGNFSGTSPDFKMLTSYTGIAGSALASTGVYSVGCCDGSGPLASNNGILYAGSKVKITAITDGTSNTWMIGEQSDHLRDTNNQPITSGYGGGVGHSGSNHSWTMGAAHPANGDASNWTGDNRHFNCTSVRYQINQIGFTNSASTGTNNNVGTNFPINSCHTGGANIGMADGSIQFFSNSTNINVISAFCTRAGGEVIQYP
jgi:prepilin-type processing-associated H-X9-DG protein